MEECDGGNFSSGFLSGVDALREAKPWKSAHSARGQGSPSRVSGPRGSPGKGADSDVAGLGWGPGVCVPHQLPGNTPAAELGELSRCMAGVVVGGRSPQGSVRRATGIGRETARALAVLRGQACSLCEAAGQGMASRLWFVLTFLRYSSQILHVTHITTAASTALRYCERGLGIFPLTPPQGCLVPGLATWGALGFPPACVGSTAGPAPPPRASLRS